MEFTNRSQMKIRSWFSKSQDNYIHNRHEESYENSNTNSIQNSPRTTHVYIAHGGLDSNEFVHRGNQSDRSYKNGFRGYKSPPIITNGNVLPRVEERRIVGSRTDRGNQTQNNNSNSQNPIKYQEPRNFVPVIKPIPNAPRVTQTEAPKVLEYEFQELTIEFSEEPYPTLGRNNLKDRIDYLNTVPITEPKSEARVFVNINNHNLNSNNNVGVYNAVKESIYENGFLDNTPRITNNVTTAPPNASEHKINGSIYNGHGSSNNIQNQNNATNNNKEHAAILDHPVKPSLQNNIENTTGNSKMSPNVVKKFNNVLNSISNVNGVNGDYQAPILLKKIETNGHKMLETQQSVETKIPKPPLSPPILPPSFFKKMAKLNKANADNIKNDTNLPPNVNIIKEISAAVNIHDTLTKNLINGNNKTEEANQSSLKRFVKQNNKQSKNLNEIQQVSFKKQSRETPSPFTIDRIVDEAFDYISDTKTYDLNKNNELQSSKEDELKIKPNETFTDKARKRLEDYQKNKKGSISNSSISSLSKPVAQPLLKI